MKKNLLIALLLGAAIAGLVESAPRLGVNVTKVYQNNGDTRVPFSVSVTSLAWTTVLAASESRRYAVIQTTSTSISAICISTISASADNCNSTRPGRRFPIATYMMEDYSEAALYARGITGSNETISLVGEYQYDSRD